MIDPIPRAVSRFSDPGIGWPDLSSQEETGDGDRT
jgi:hypothetical protein